MLQKIYPFVTFATPWQVFSQKESDGCQSTQSHTVFDCFTGNAVLGSQLPFSGSWYDLTIQCWIIDVNWTTWHTQVGGVHGYLCVYARCSYICNKFIHMYVYVCSCTFGCARFWVFIFACWLLPSTCIASYNRCNATWCLSFWDYKLNL